MQRSKPARVAPDTPSPACHAPRQSRPWAQRWRRRNGSALDLEQSKALFALLRKWMIAQIADQDKDFEQQIWDSKTLRGSAAQPDGADNATRFITQVTLYARGL